MMRSARGMEYKATSTLSDCATKWTPVTGTITGIIFRDRSTRASRALNSARRESYPALDNTVSTAGQRRAPEADAATSVKLAQPSVTPDTDTRP